MEIENTVEVVVGVETTQTTGTSKLPVGRATLHDAGDTAQDLASQLIEMNLDSDRILPRCVVLALAGVRAPRGEEPVALGKEHDLWAVQVYNLLRRDLMRQLGRPLITVHAQGFRLGSVGEAASHTEQQFNRSLKGAFRKARFNLSHLRDEEMSAEERQEATATRARIGRLRGMMTKVDKGNFA